MQDFAKTKGSDLSPRLSLSPGPLRNRPQVCFDKNYALRLDIHCFFITLFIKLNFNFFFLTVRWSSWSKWSNCKNCKRTRKRKCTYPKPYCEYISSLLIYYPLKAVFFPLGICNIYHTFNIVIFICDMCYICKYLVFIFVSVFLYGTFDLMIILCLAIILF